MAKAELKTKPTAAAATDYVATIEHKTRRNDAEFLLGSFKKITGWKAQMWGPTIIGYGRYAYNYESGREGEFLVTGFAPRKANLVLYIMPGYQDMQDKLQRLGKHRIGQSCLYINKLADVDLDVLEEIVRDGVDYMRQNYEVWEK